ncbi:twin-arginine translocation signal domain-containing protein [Streptomyces sp. NPDC051940]|uniref:twin-arginine translocation signal domain-containing protein n=1 Tax=Streptomyces sp. NPDC051940 TaxID=3155675 RepID=UPI00344350D2
MTPTRRQVLAGAAALGAAAAFTACSDEPPAGGSPPRPPGAGTHLRSGTLYARIGDTLTAVSLADGRTRASFPGAVPDPGRQRLHWRDGSGHLRITETATGRDLHRLTAPAGEIRAAAAGLPLVALGPAGTRRARTRIALVSPQGTRGLTLPGAVEPEAFSDDGTTLYVLDHLDDGYRVRMVDLAAGEMTPLLTRDKTPVPAEERMRGRYRQSALSPDRTVLYSLYTHQADHLHTRDLVAARDSAPGVHAFVHVLNLRERWAYCLDLPEEMGRGEASGHCLALSADGLSLYVFDSGSGTVAAADTAQLTITTVRRVKTPPDPSYAVVVGDELCLAAGDRMHRLARARLTPAAGWTLPGPAAGVALRGHELLVGVPGRVLLTSVADGRRNGVLAVPGLREVLYAVPAGWSRPG